MSNRVARKERGIFMNQFSKLSYLDEIRLSHSTDDFKRIFYELGKSQRPKAIGYLNEDRLYFSSLFILTPEIQSLALYERLNARNIIALKMCAQIVTDRNLFGDTAIPENNNMTYSVLKWMLQTGAAMDGFSDEYDMVLDAAASLLIKTYKDTSVLPMIADMIFERNRKGYLIHDLVWCFYQARTTYCLRLIARYLCSPNRCDVELARQLLHFIPNETGDGADLQLQYENFLAWLRENDEFLYFTGENLQLTSDPKAWRVNLDAKYLCKKFSPHDRNPLQPLTQADRNRLQQFHKLCRKEEKLLSKYSCRMHERNPRSWNQWMQYPVDKQIEIAKAGLEGIR
jgi:hypothetical protein